MTVDGRNISIDRAGALWAYSLGFWYRDIPDVFIEGTPHAYYWGLGASGMRFPKSHWVRKSVEA